MAPDGKNRRYTAHVSTSCSGPDVAKSSSRSIKGSLVRRDAADLRYTTADVDWIHEHFAKHEDFGAKIETHIRRINPTLEEFLADVHQAIENVNSYSDEEDWDGGRIILAYAGHGQIGTGGLVFSNGVLEADDLVRYIAALVPSSPARRLRIDLVLDSCFASAFALRFLSTSWREFESQLFLCTFLAAALSDEYAWETPRLGHGVFTYSFKAEIDKPTLFQPRWLLVLKLLWLRLQDKHRHSMRSNGVSFLTHGEQHSLEYENGSFTVHGLGYFSIYDLEEVTVDSLVENIRMLKLSSQYMNEDNT